MTKDEKLSSWIERLLLAYARRPLTIPLRRRFGDQPNDRDQAEDFAKRKLLPALEKGRLILIDFRDTGMVTQSFIHALISEAVKSDSRHAAKIQTANTTRAQQAVFDLALRHMLDPATNRVRGQQSLQTQGKAIEA